jgi:glycosyltransferase involved in cell wall biosynthesis
MTKKTGLKILAAMPAYNEEKYIGSIILKLKQYTDDIIIVDDGSSDGTAEVARLAGATVLRHSDNMGKGTAVQDILAEARKREPDILVLLDADAQHNPDDIPQLIKPIMDGYDMVIGSREEQSDKTPRYRRFGQKVLSFSTRAISKTDVADSESGFRALSPKAINTLELKEQGFAIESEMIARAADNNLRVTEVAITNIYHADGSTLNPVKHGIGVLTRILTLISERRPLFFFGIGGTILTTIGFLAGLRVIYIFTSLGKIALGTAVISMAFITVGVLCIFTGIILHALARRLGQ